MGLSTLLKATGDRVYLPDERYRIIALVTARYAAERGSNTVRAQPQPLTLWCCGGKGSGRSWALSHDFIPYSRTVRRRVTHGCTPRILAVDLSKLLTKMSASPVARQAVAQAQPQSIPRRIQINSPAEMPHDYSTTPGGTMFSTTPGGECTLG